VLLLHGGSGHKADDAVVEQVRMLTCDTGFLVATIDGPIHGARIGAPGLAGEAMRDRFLTQWSVDPLIDAMVEDWQAALDGLSTLPCVDADRIGWLGTSMGTAYGLPFVAACPAIKAAVLGKWSCDHVHSERLGDDAARVQCPVLFIQRWDDELFSRPGQLDLFDRIGSADKRLHVYPGSHFLRGGEPLADSIAFMKSRL
jgi:dienelactone hydrolase